MIGLHICIILSNTLQEKEITNILCISKLQVELTDYYSHGPNTYPGGFVYLYLILYYLTGGSLQFFQIIWAFLEMCTLLLVKKISLFVLEHGNTSITTVTMITSILPLLSNRLHLYNVRVVINDFPPVFGMFLFIYSFLNIYHTYYSDALKNVTISFHSKVKRELWNLVNSSLYSLIVANKLNFVFYGPAIFVIYLQTLGWKESFFQFSWMAIIQVQSSLLINVRF